MGNKTKCRVCGEEITIERSVVYTATNPQQTGFAALAGGTMLLYDVFDCPQCGCQNTLCERKPKASEYAPAPENGLNDLAAEIHQNALAHGWWDEPRTFPEIIALCHSELSEGLEEYRSGRPELYYLRDETDEKVISTDFSGYTDEKPSGIAVELADTIIRILDYCGGEEIDIEAVLRLKHEYNKGRPYRHGGKKC